LRPSSSLDYLLEDEEEPKRGWGKLVLIVIALGLAIGLGYLHFKQTGFGGLTATDKKPAAAKPTADTAQGADSSGAAGPATPDGTGPAAGASGAGMAPSTSGATTSSAESAAPQVTSTPQGAAGAQNSLLPSQTIPSQAQPSDPNLPAPSAPPVANAPDKQVARVEAPPEPRPATIRPAAKPAAAKPIDPVTNAERYIYGRGVRQDCDHGLRLLKPPAEQSNAKAMILLGALYSTGTCAPRDLPTAYRWFALALHKEPDNQALQDDLQKLWGQMTQPERQLAIKLSQ
jgi:hypothetical protein